MAPIDDVIGDIIKREGAPTDDPLDKGGRTAFGISETANPEAWKDGKVTEEEAREIYERKYVKNPHFDLIKDRQLQAQLIDFGVTSGPAIAIKKLQSIIKVEEDGILGPTTLTALDMYDPRDINNCLVAERVKMIGRLVTVNPLQVKFLSGWLNRALDWIF